MLTTRTWTPAVALLLSVIAAGCSNRSHDAQQPETPPQTTTPTETEPPHHTVTAIAGTGGNISPASVSVVQGERATLTVTPDAGFNIAGVTPSGCTGSLTGNIYITEPITADCTVAATFIAISVIETFTVTANASAGGSITPASVSVTQGASTTLTVTPDTGFNIASVNASGCSGTLTGTTYITGPITANCTVAASFAAITVTTFTVTASAGAGGSITPGSVSVAQGANTILTVTADTGFSIASVTASGCSGILSGTTYTTGPITADCAVAASFVANSTTAYTVTASASAGGSITPSSVSVPQGTSAVLTVTPNVGFNVDTITPTGCTGSLMGNTYTTEPLTANCAIAVSFTANIYTVTASAGAGGSITPASASVIHGANTILTVTPDTGFSITNVSTSGCSGSLSGTAYTTGPITAHCAVTVTFALTTSTSIAQGIAAGGSHSCALTNGGAARCWGDNFFGELGDGTTTNSIIPVTVIGLSGAATALVTGAQHTCALTTTGDVQCWGYNRYGQLGNGSTVSTSTPVTVSGLSSPATALVAGSYHTCALTSAGAAQCWGYNTTGQLGNGTTTNSTTAVTVTSLSSAATRLAAGAQHTCAITSDGTAQCWGSNTNGQLGNGTITSSTVPVTVTGLSGSATIVAAGAQHSCALTSTGVIQCWGFNANGQLGNGSTVNSTVPVTVTGLSGSTTALAAGGNHTCVLSSTGTVQCWGKNANGQLGNAGTTDASTPVAVSGLSAVATALVAGYGHTCALTNTGAAQCWGYNLYGQLGNGSTTNSSLPVTVTGLGGTP